MLLDLKKLFGERGNEPVEVEVLRDMIVQTEDGSRHCSKGERLEIPRKSLAVFDREDVRILTKSSREPIADPTPKRAEPTPPPERWKALPECFSKWWDLNERFRVARIHTEAINQCRRELLGTNAPLDITDASTVLAIQISGGGPRENFISTTHHHNVDSWEFRQLTHYLNAATEGAEYHLKELRRTKALEVQRLFLQCGMERLEIGGKLDELIDELTEIGFKLFSHRVSALGLGEGHIRRLYQGSVDFQKYGLHDRLSRANQSDLCILRTNALGVTEQFFDCEVVTSASHYQTNAERLEALSALLVEGRAELVRTLKAAA